jgi:hypothetical protein
MGTKKTVLIGFEMKMMLSTVPTSNAHKMFRRILEDPFSPTAGVGGGRAWGWKENEIDKMFRRILPSKCTYTHHCPLPQVFFYKFIGSAFPGQVHQFSTILQGNLSVWLEFL